MKGSKGSSEDEEDEEVVNDDDTRSIFTVVYHELDHVDEEDEESKIHGLLALTHAVLIMGAEIYDGIRKRGVTLHTV